MPGQKERSQTERSLRHGGLREMSHAAGGSDGTVFTANPDKGPMALWTPANKKRGSAEPGLPAPCRWLAGPS